MHELTQLIKDDMRPALGVTEPGAIAYAVSKAKSYVPGELEQVTLLLNSGMYKNAYTCGIPNSHFYGNEYAAALGVVAGKPEKELESLADVTEADNMAAEQLVKDGKITVKMSKKPYFYRSLCKDNRRRGYGSDSRCTYKYCSY